MKRFGYGVVLIAFAFSLAAQAAQFELSESQWEGFPNTLEGRDFFFLRQEGREGDTRFDRESSLEDCRAKIAKVVCLVDPAQKGQKPMDRVCLAGGEAYAVHFERLFDQYPRELKRMFCSLERIFIENQFFGTAYAAPLKYIEGGATGAIVGIRRSVLDERLDLPTWASWKEQLSFGGVAGAYRPSPDLPLIRASTKTEANDFLYFVISHEFGHLFDSANGLNKKSKCEKTKDNELPNCEMAPESWGALSWLTTRVARPENEFALRSALCFYSCDGKKIPREKIPSVYADLGRSNFISLYATTQPWDDFADSLAYYLSFQNIDLRYRIDTRQGALYDIRAKMNSPLFAKKVDYIKSFLSRKTIVYP